MLGLIFLAVIVGLMSLSVAVYRHTFSSSVSVTLRTDHAGNQLLVDSDVKVRGVLVGSVRSVHSDGDGACVTLGLDPSQAGLIPDNVSAQILPKTLFGDQFVSLVLPPSPGPHLRNGDVIGQDRTATALETERVLGDLLPLLTAVRPAELNATLTALATALSGRGAQLGATIAGLDSYLRQLNPVVPGLIEDIDKLGRLAARFDAVLPDLRQALDNLVTSARTITGRGSALDSLLVTADDTSNLLNSFLADNRARLIMLTGATDSVFQLLAQYSPEYSCLLAGIVTDGKRVQDTIHGSQINLWASLSAPKLGAYHSSETPRPVTGLGPHCLGLPHPQVPFQFPDYLRCFNDGAALTADACVTGGDAAKQSAVGSAPETALVDALIADRLGTTPDRVPPIDALLLAPILRGATLAVGPREG